MSKVLSVLAAIAMFFAVAAVPTTADAHGYKHRHKVVRVVVHKHYHAGYPYWGYGWWGYRSLSYGWRGYRWYGYKYRWYGYKAPGYTYWPWFGWGWGWRW